MKISIEVTNKSEAEFIKKAMSDAPSRALVVGLGALLSLESDQARHRVMNYVADRCFDEQNKNHASGP